MFAIFAREGLNTVLVAFSFVIGTVVALVIDEFSKKRDIPTIPRGLMDALVFVGVGVLVSSMLVAPLGEILGPRYFFFN